MSLRRSAEEMKTNALRLLGYRITDEEGAEHRILYHIQDGRIAKIRIFHTGIPSVGDICLARIVKLDRAMKLAYLEIAGNRAFLSLERLEKAQVLLQNREFNGKLNQEDRIVVRVTAEAHEKKPMRVDLKAVLNDVQKEAALHRVHTGVLVEAASMQKEIMDALLSDPYARFLTEDEMLYREVQEAADKAVTEMPDVTAKGAAAQHADGKGAPFKELRERIVFYQDNCIRMCNLYGLTSMLERITKERVSLKSGAQLVITPTEAFTVVDVNSGKRGAKKERAEEILEVNLEAARELAYQIEARRLGGIVLVDFINMKSAEHETILTKELKERLKAIDPPARLEDITKLGIAEITRQRSEAGIREIKALLDKTILLK